MAEYNTRDLRMAISKTPETTYNAIKTAAADDFVGMLTTGRNPMLPDKEKNDDTGKVGRGQEFATEQRSGYIIPPSIEIAEELNVDVIAKLLRRGMGGVVSLATAQPANAVKHTFGLLNSSALGVARQLPSSTVAWSVGGADYLWGGVVMESIRIEQSGAAVPTATITMLGSGLNKRIRDLNTGGGTPVYNGPNLANAAPGIQKYMFGPETQVSFSITSAAGVTTPYTITDAGRLTAFSMTLANNHRSDDRRPGDPRNNSANPRGGWYTNRMLFGDRSVAAEMTLMIDDALTEVAAANEDLLVTNFSYRTRGNFLAGGTTQASLEVIFPQCYFRNIRAADDSGNAVVSMGIFPSNDPILGPMIVNVTNTTGTVAGYYD